MHHSPHSGEMRSIYKTKNNGYFKSTRPAILHLSSRLRVSSPAWSPNSRCLVQAAPMHYRIIWFHHNDASRGAHASNQPSVAHATVTLVSNRDVSAAAAVHAISQVQLASNCEELSLTQSRYNCRFVDQAVCRSYPAAEVGFEFANRKLIRNKAQCGRCRKTASVSGQKV